ncbi:hypothetical protein OH797_32000 [Streptomyces anulatus]|uniref:hypothetical protein n=1 Tax=Streptomyces anulatus TaxID=1892 RepID=UPI00386E5A2F
MISKWKPGTRVQVNTPDEPDIHGWLGTVEPVNYAERLPATSVLLDQDAFQMGAFFYDEELEEVAA